MLRPGQVPAKPGDHFIQHKQGAIPIAEFLEPLQKPIARLIEPSGFEYNASDLIGILLKELLDTNPVVVVKLDSSRPDALRNPARHRRGAYEPVRRGEERMIAADRHIVAASVSTSQPDCSVDCVRPVLAELHHFRRRHQLQESLRAFDFDRRWSSEVGAKPHLPRCGIHDGFVPMSQCDRAQTHSIFDVLVAVQVPHVAALATDDEGWRQFRELIVPLGVRMGSTWNELLRSAGQRLTLFKAHSAQSSLWLRPVGALHLALHSSYDSLKHRLRLGISCCSD